MVHSQYVYRSSLPKFPEKSKEKEKEKEKKTA